MVNFFILSSGSNGYCYYIGNEHTALLIDAGIGPRTIRKRMQNYNLSLDNVEFILVTHDHIDHIKSLGIVAERLKIPVYATERLHKALDLHSCTRNRLSGCVRKTIIGNESIYKGVSFIPFNVPHDATETVGYFIDFYGVKFAFITDIGAVNDDVIEYCRKAQVLIFESNYDLDMLLCGSYTPALKNRIIKGEGHISNEQAASAIKRIYNKNLKSIFLCHLSENNNTPNLAYKAVEGALSSVGVKIGCDITLTCLPRSEVSELYVF